MVNNNNNDIMVTPTIITAVLGGARRDYLAPKSHHLCHGTTIFTPKFLHYYYY